MIYIEQQLSLWMDKRYKHVYMKHGYTNYKIKFIYLFKFKHQLYKLSYIKVIILQNTRVHSLEPRLQKVNIS